MGRSPLDEELLTYAVSGAANGRANEALALADRVAFLSVGSVAWQAAVADVEEDLLVRSYLGMELEPT